MTKVNNRPSGYHTLNGKFHEILSGKFGQTYSLPQGAVEPWKSAPVGSIHLYEGEDGMATFYKIKDDKANDDWYVPSGMGMLVEKFTYADFTDGTGASGTLVLDAAIPAGAVVEGSELWDVVGFAGDTTAVITVGDGTDVDRYNTGTPSVFAALGYLSLGVASGTQFHAAALSTVTVTITKGADWGTGTSGSATLIIRYKMLGV